jgi:hypothetical protein
MNQVLINLKLPRQINIKLVVYAICSIAFIPQAFSEGRSSVSMICPEVTSKQPIKCLNKDFAVINGNRLSAYTTFTQFNSMRTVFHVWYFKDVQIFKTKIKPTQAGWRGVTNLEIQGRIGSWRFELENENHQLLESISFIVKSGLKGITAKILSSDQLVKASKESSRNELVNSELRPNSIDNSSKKSISTSSTSKQVDNLLVSSFVNYFRINSTDTNNTEATILSRANPGIRLQWAHSFSQGPQLLLGAKYTKVNLQNSNNFTISPAGFGLYSYDLGLGFSPIQGWKFSTTLSYSDELFIRRLSSENLQITLDRVTLPLLSLGVNWEFIQKPWLSGEFKIDAGILTSKKTSNYLIKIGQFYNAGIDLTKYFTSINTWVGSNLSYGQQFNKSSLVSETRSDLTFGLHGLWSFRGELLE